MSISVVLVDDHTMLRQGLRRALEAEGIEVIGEAADGNEGVRVSVELRPGRRADGRVDAEHGWHRRHETAPGQPI
jgi:chemotaxis response regulator CheB